MKGRSRGRPVMRPVAGQPLEHRVLAFAALQLFEPLIQRGPGIDQGALAGAQLEAGRAGRTLAPLQLLAGGADLVNQIAPGVASG